MTLDAEFMLRLIGHQLDVPAGSTVSLTVGSDHVEMPAEAGMGPWGLRIRARADVQRRMLLVFQLPGTFSRLDALLGTLPTQGLAIGLDDQIYVCGRTEVAIESVTDEHLIGSFVARAVERPYDNFLHRIAPDTNRDQTAEQVLEMHARGGPKPTESLTIPVEATFRAHRAAWASDSLLAALVAAEKR